MLLYTRNYLLLMSPFTAKDQRTALIVFSSLALWFSVCCASLLCSCTPILLFLSHLPFIIFLSPALLQVLSLGNQLLALSSHLFPIQLVFTSTLQFSLCWILWTVLSCSVLLRLLGWKTCSLVSFDCIASPAFLIFKYLDDICYICLSVAQMRLDPYIYKSKWL